MLSLPAWLVESLRVQSAGWFVAAFALAALVLAWIGYQAVTEWQQSAVQLVQRRVEAAADLFATALNRDMRGVQASLLLSLSQDQFLAESPAEPIARVASALARYPYPEVFFGWRVTPSAPETADSVTFYARSARPPSWMAFNTETNLFPVVFRQEPATAKRLQQRIASDGALGRRFSVFTLTIDNQSYQAIASLFYNRHAGEGPAAVFGFLVNLDWVRRNYFDDFAAQMSSIASDDRDILLSVFDEQGAIAGRSGQANPPGGQFAARRPFLLAFFDPALVMIDSPADLMRESWTAQAVALSDPTLLAANRGAQRTLVLAAAAAIILALGLASFWHGVRTRSELAELRADFVSAVTHSLKTPVAGIRAINESLTSGRVTSPDMLREYGQLAVQETKHLGRLIDNLLAYSRVTDIADVYLFESLPLDEIVETRLSQFAAQLTLRNVRMHVNLPAGLPPVRADGAALALAIDNVIDNAIRYSRGECVVTIEAHIEQSNVVLEIGDSGQGIPPDELSNVTQRFFRGRTGQAGGTGLGLTIASRIASDHGGSLSIRSSVGVGTTVGIALPIARDSV